MRIPSATVLCQKDQDNFWILKKEIPIQNPVDFCFCPPKDCFAAEVFVPALLGFQFT